jgi:tetratricopeptide (TPR) repeat protein
MRASGRPWYLLPLALSIASASALSAPLARADESLAANVAAARRHFDKARAFYAQGAYHEAIAELDAAHALDPSAKDLVFNLGIVHEKLGDIDDALQWFRLYAGMNLTQPERDRADAFVHRLEGAQERAKHDHDQDAVHPAAPGEGAAPPAAPAETVATPAPAAPPAPPTPPPAPSGNPPGGIDTLTLVTGGIAAAGLLAGVTLGIKALVDQPGISYVTGRDGTHDDLLQQVDQAHTEAVAADVSFTIAAAAGIACAYLFWSRPHSRPGTAKSATVSAAPLPKGLAIVVGGSL